MSTFAVLLVVIIPTRRNIITAKQLQQMTKSKWPSLMNFSKSNTVAPKAVDIQTALLENFFFFNRRTMMIL